MNGEPFDPSTSSEQASSGQAVNGEGFVDWSNRQIVEGVKSVKAVEIVQGRNAGITVLKRVIIDISARVFQSLCFLRCLMRPQHS